MKTFTYNLINTENLTDEQIVEAEEGLYRGVYVCQQDFERLLDVGHAINLFPDAVDEAYVTVFEVDGDDVVVELDCSQITF
jgi:hypothetical protein